MDSEASEAVPLFCAWGRAELVYLPPFPIGIQAQRGERHWVTPGLRG